MNDHGRHLYLSYLTHKGQNLLYETQGHLKTVYLEDPGDMKPFRIYISQIAPD